MAAQGVGMSDAEITRERAELFELLAKLVHAIVRRKQVAANPAATEAERAIATGDVVTAATRVIFALEDFVEKYAIESADTVAHTVTRVGLRVLTTWLR